MTLIISGLSYENYHCSFVVKIFDKVIIESVVCYQGKTIYLSA